MATLYDKANFYAMLDSLTRQAMDMLDAEQPFSAIFIVDELGPRWKLKKRRKQNEIYNNSSLVHRHRKGRVL